MTEPTGGTLARPAADLAHCRAAHAQLLETVSGLDDVTLRGPSLLPGWTVGHVLGHLAGHADSIVRRMVGVIEDRVVDQYPGGPQARAAEIERLAALPLDELVPAVRGSADRVDAIFDQVPDDAWERVSRSVSGKLVAASRLPFSRLREVEVHHTDLGLGHPPSAWPPVIAERSLPDVLAGLPSRTDPGALLAWALGRGPAPELQPWD
jgi:maleylpyruvate isomerase